jgi:hypothetical protein
LRFDPDDLITEPEGIDDGGGGQVVPVGITVDADNGIPKHEVALALTPATVAVIDT